MLSAASFAFSGYTNNWLHQPRAARPAEGVSWGSVVDSNVQASRSNHWAMDVPTYRGRAPACAVIFATDIKALQCREHVAVELT